MGAAARPTTQSRPSSTTPAARKPAAAPSAGTGIMGTIAGSMVGNMLGNTLMNAMSGGSEAAPAPQEQGQYQYAPEATSGEYMGQNEHVFSDDQNQNQLCPMEKNTVINCLGNSNDCQWAIDLLNKCQRTATQQASGEKYAYN